MSDPPDDARNLVEDQHWDRGWDEHRLRQAARGLELSPAERLRWLEETLATMRRWLGRA